MQTQILESPAMPFSSKRRFEPVTDYEYLLVVNPAAVVSSEIIQEKKLFTEKYKEQIAIKTKPHITVANFLAKEGMEETIIRYLHRILSVKQGFRTMLNNYSGFPMHTIYIRLQNHAPFAQLAQDLKVIDHYIQSNGYPETRLISNPHVTIARKLPVNVYNKAMFDYSQKLFYASFMVNELVLLRRQHQFDTCRQVNVFKLLPGETNDNEAVMQRGERPDRVEQGEMEF